MASLHLSHRHRGRKLLTYIKDFQKTRDCQSIAGFLLNNQAARMGGEKKAHVMNTNYRKLTAEFGPETRFTVEPVAAAPFRAVEENRFETLRLRLLAERLDEAWEPEANSLVRRAANEAAALAWLTPYPLLVFPVLFEEKADAASLVAERQQEVRQRSRELLAL